MSDEDHTCHQDAFLTEQIDTIAATIAFGIGIDKSNVSYVIHVGMLKSLEHYQQESDRADHDGVEAGYWLCYSSRDVMSWNNIITDSHGETRQAAATAPNRIVVYCTSVVCHHASLVHHFSQSWDRASCGTCDVCLGKIEVVDDALVTGQKILSCVLRVNENVGADYVSMVLSVSRDKRILKMATIG